MRSFPHDTGRMAILSKQILAVWILAAKLPNSDLNFARPEQNHQKNPAKFTRKSVQKNSPRISAEALSPETGHFAYVVWEEAYVTGGRNIGAH